jgi:hypothetical protein
MRLFLWQHAGKERPVDTGTGEIISARESFSLYRLEAGKIKRESVALRLLKQGASSA